MQLNRNMGSRNTWEHLEAYQKYQETSHLSLPRSKLGLEIKTFKLQNKSIMNAKLATELF